MKVAELIKTAEKMRPGAEWTWGDTKSRLNENEAEFEVCQNAARNGAGCRMIGLAVRA